MVKVRQTLLFIRCMRVDFLYLLVTFINKDKTVSNPVDYFRTSELVEVWRLWETNGFFIYQISFTRCQTSMEFVEV